MLDPVEDAHRFRFGLYEMDITAGHLHKAGHRIPLQEKPFRLLVLLVERPGELIPREEIRRRLWETDTFVDFDQGLNTAVKKLRQALGDSADNPRFIETQPRKGYRFLASVERVLFRNLPLANTAPPRKGPSPESTPKPIKLPEAAVDTERRWWSTAIATGAAIFILAGITIYSLKLSPRALLQPDQIHSIAVLPLVNLTHDPLQEYLSDGLTDALITGIARTGTVRVISRTSIMAYKDSPKRLPEIAKELNVDAVLEGSLLPSGNRIRITAKLIHAATDHTLLAETYETDLGDVLALQNLVSGTVARAITGKLSQTKKSELATFSDPEAYKEYLKGRFFCDKRSAVGLSQGIEHFREAIARDPRNALAYAGLADCYNLLSFYGGSPPRTSFARAEEAAVKALNLKEDLAEAHAALAFSRLHHKWDWKGAESEFRRAISLDPNYANARHWYSHYLLALRRNRDALAEAQKALALDPLSLSINTHLGHHYLYTREYDRAIHQLRQTLEMNPDAAQTHFWLGRAYEIKQDFPKAFREFRRSMELAPEDAQSRAGLGHSFAAAGQTAAARTVLEELHRMAQARYISPYFIAVVYAGLQDAPNTIRQLQRAYDERADGILYLKIDPYFDALRADAGFQALIHNIEVGS